MATTIKDSNRRQLTPEEEERLWQHGMHEENILIERLNFILLLESVLLGAVALLFGQDNLVSSRPLVLRALMLLGLVLTLMLGYASARQRYVFLGVRRRLREHLPEYAETVREREKVRWPISSIDMLTFGVPITFLLVWIVLLFAM